MYDTEKSPGLASRMSGATLAPRAEDALDTATITSSIELAIPVPMAIVDGVRDSLSWHVHMKGEPQVSVASGQTSIATAIRLSLSRQNDDGTTTDTLDLLPLTGWLGQTELRRLVAGLNALVAALPYWPEPEDVDGYES